MKIMLVLVLILHAFTFADISLREFWQIVVPENFFSDDIPYEHFDPSEPPIPDQCANFFGYKLLDPRYRPYFYDDDVLPLSVDTNVYFGANIVEYNYADFAINLMILSTAIVSYYDKINDLFSHYYECGHLNVTREIVDDYIQKISFAIDTSYKSNFLCEYNYDENGSVYYYTDARTGPVDIPNGIYEVIDRLNGKDSIPDAIFKRNNALKNVHQYQGRPYTLMDVQGRILEQGVFSSQQIRVNQPAILKIQGQKPKLLK